MAKKMDAKHCIGCEDNFYNGNNPYGVKECWGLETAKLMTRYRICVNSPTVKSSFVKVNAPSCYHEKGYAYYNDLPAHCK